MKKRAFIIEGLAFLIIGAVFLFNAFSGMTGYVVLENVDVSVSGLLGLVFVGIGLLLMMAGTKKKPLEKIVLISKQATERSKNDPRVNQNMQRYANEIRMISADPMHRPQEIIGQFHVSPRGHKDIRVAWHRKVDSKQEKEIIYIDDYLYHINDTDYVDLWNRKASKREITLNNYEFE